MGFGYLVSNLGAGQYVVDLDYGDAIRQAKIARITEQIADYEAQLAEIAAEIVDQRARVDVVVAELQSVIASYVGVPVPPSLLGQPDRAYDFTARKLLLERAALDRLYGRQTSMRLARDDLLRRRAALESSPNISERRPAWCADYTIDAATGRYVRMIEVPGEQSLALIAPGAPANSAADGAIYAREIQAAHQVLLNAMLLPGWQRHLPTYRTGRIRALDHTANRCVVDLDDARSSAQSLPINEARTLVDVPIEYMTCNSKAFRENDHVVIELRGRSWSSPVVVGFVSNPRRCAILTAEAQPGYSPVEVLPTQTIPGAVAPLPPYPSALYRVLLGWHIQWSHTSGSPAPLREWITSRMLPATTWDADARPYTNRVASAVYYQVPDLWLDTSDDYWTWNSSTVRRVSDGGSPPKSHCYVTSNWTVETPAFLYYDGTLERFAPLDRPSRTEDGPEYYVGLIEDTVTDATIIDTWGDSSFTRFEHVPTSYFSGAITWTFAGETSYGMPYSYEVTWLAASGSNRKLFDSVDPSTPD